MSRADMDAAYKAALERKKTERKVEYHLNTVLEERKAWLDGRTLERMSVYTTPDWRDPQNLAEYLDDRVIEWAHMGACPEAPVMIAVAEAARESAAAAARALKAARELTPEAAWSVYQNLDRWPGIDETRRLGADALSAELLAEWRRLKLPVEDPALAAARRRPAGRGLLGAVEAKAS